MVGLTLGLVFVGCDDDGSNSGTGGSTTSGTGGSAGGSSGTGGSSSGSGGSSSGSGGSSSGTGGAGGTAECFDATRLWFEDFETGNYDRWTSSTYGNDWNSGFCHANGFSENYAVSPTHSHRSEITCVSDQSHRGYGGLQFDGDTRVPAYTNQGSGIEAPHGVVNTYWSWLAAPYAFENGKWFSFWTVNNDCGWNDTVITLGLEDASNVLTPAHIVNTGGTVNFVNNPPAFPMQTWARTTIYINFHDGSLHIWQDGTKLLDGTFSRSDTDICQWHWGAYANKDNDDVVLYEDDLSIWKLNEPWADFAVEPYFGVAVPVCSN